MRLSAPRFIGLAMSATLLAFLIPATAHAATSDSGYISYPALTAQLTSVNNGSIADSPSTGTPATASGVNWANCVNGSCTVALDHGRTQAFISVLGGITPKSPRNWPQYLPCATPSPSARYVRPVRFSRHGLSWTHPCWR